MKRWNVSRILATEGLVLHLALVVAMPECRSRRRPSPVPVNTLLSAADFPATSRAEARHPPPWRAPRAPPLPSVLRCPAGRGEPPMRRVSPRYLLSSNLRAHQTRRSRRVLVLRHGQEQPFAFAPWLSLRWSARATGHAKQAQRAATGMPALKVCVLTYPRMCSSCIRSCLHRRLLLLEI